MRQKNMLNNRFTNLMVIRMFTRKHLFSSRYIPSLSIIGIVLILMVSIVSCSDHSYLVRTSVAQLFIDDFLIESSDNLKRTLHQPVKDFGGERPIISLSDEFGDLGATLEAMTIIYDKKIDKYVMFALGFSPEWRSFETDRRWEFYKLFRYTSLDGLHWVKGDDGQAQCVFPRSREDLYDEESGTYASFSSRFTCYYDTANTEYPYKAWQGFNGWGDKKGMFYLRSGDGIDWERGQMVVDMYEKRIADLTYREIHQNGRNLIGPLDNSLFIYDATENRFLGIFKFISKEKVENDNGLRSRAYAFFSPPLSRPFDINKIKSVQLVPPAADENNDKAWDEYYSSTAWRYESLWLGDLKIYHKNGDYPWSASGCAYLKLIWSRDGLNWSKVCFLNDEGVPEVFIPNGREGGNGGRNDGGYITEFSQGPLRINDELIFYYGSSSYGKKKKSDAVIISGGGIFRARLRIDGFVSVDSGELTTKLLSFRGNDLFVNAIGPVSVEALGVGEIEGDALKQRVSFDGKRLRDIAKGNNIRLRFNVGEGGQLYSFTFGSEKAF